MTPCMWCRTPIEDGARRCPHCRTWQRPGADAEETARAQIVDDSLIYFFKFASFIIAILVLIAVAVGGYDLNNARVESWRAQSEAMKSQNDARLASVESARARLDSQTAQTAAKAAAEGARRDAAAFAAEYETLIAAAGSRLDEADARLAELNVEIEQVRGRPVSPEDDAQGFSLQNLSNAVTAQANLIVQLESRVAALAAGASTGQTEAVTAAEAANLRASLAVRQSASEVAGLGSSDRRSFDVTFRLCARDGEACESLGGAPVSRVVYRLNPRWFTQADVPVISAANDFAYTVRVWGSTRVDACIFLAGRPNEPIARGGAISLSPGPTFWTAPLSGEDPCATITAG